MAYLPECSVCLSAFVEPHVLPDCGHTFCLECIRQISDSKCPLCRARFDGRRVCPNFALQHLLEECPDAAGQGGGGRVTGTALNLHRNHVGNKMASTYCRLGVPPQLAQMLMEEDAEIALRVYVLDNSGSMTAGDGCVLEEKGQGEFQSRPASRWEELKHMALHHAMWNAELGVPSEFVLLNSPCPSTPVDGQDLVRIDAQKGSTKLQIQILRDLLDRTRPGMGTPLTERLEDLRCRLRSSAPELQHKGRKLMLILVTDGCPNGGRESFVAAIRRLAQEYPVNVVVRLCTNDSNVQDFYSDIDKEVELSLDVLDDLKGEAKDVYHFNPWLTYSPILHTVREAGTLSKLLDFLDERSLTSLEVSLCAQLLLRGADVSPYPWQPDAFLASAERDLATAPSVFCGRRGCWAPTFQLGALRAAVHPSKHSLVAKAAHVVGLGSVAEWWYTGRQPWKSGEEDEYEEDDGEESEREPPTLLVARQGLAAKDVRAVGPEGYNAFNKAKTPEHNNCVQNASFTTAVRHSKASTPTLGQQLDYLSTSLGMWVPCVATQVSPTGEIMIDVKPGAWISREQQATSIRPRCV